MENTVLFGGERPGDVVAFQHPFGGEAVGCVAETAISFGGRLVADEKTAVGYVPPRAERQELLRSCGFRYFTTFQKGKPDFRPL